MPDDEGDPASTTAPFSLPEYVIKDFGLNSKALQSNSPEMSDDETAVFSAWQLKRTLPNNKDPEGLKTFGV